ncbi:hypothetical protein ScPMuIL_015322 [Solemya velum]
MGGTESTPQEIPAKDKETIDKLLNGNKVVVFSKTYCSYCKEVKKIFADIGENFEAVELDKRKDGKDIQSALAIMTKGATVPRVFICGKFVGGSSDVKDHYKSGKLVSLLEGCSSEG